MGHNCARLFAHLAVTWPTFHGRQVIVAVEHIKLCGFIQLIPNWKERTALGLSHLLGSRRDDRSQHVLHAVFHIAKAGGLMAQATIHRPQDCMRSPRPIDLKPSARSLSG